MNISEKPNFLIKLFQWIIAPLFIIMVASVVYTSGWGIYDDTLVRVGTFSLAVILLLSYKMVYKERALLNTIIDLIMIGVIIAATYRYYLVSEELESGLYELQNIDVFYAIAGLAVLGEMMRRVIGLPLVIVCSISIVYALYGNLFPDFMSSSGIGLNELLTTVWYSFDGVFGRPIAVVTSTILVYILFGALLEALGVGDVLLKVAFKLTRHFAGGDAHAAVLASGLFGTISGSAVANVVGTGVITIPMIKKRGFSAKFAGAVEATASSGGQLMPPIMGAVAFIMADVTGIPYLSICLAALIPALFYYGSLFAFISTEAKNLNMKPQPNEAKVALTFSEKLNCLPFIIPLLLIIILMVQGSSPAMAGFWALISATFLGFAIQPELFSQPKRVWGIIVKGAKSCATITVAVASVGIIIAVMNNTGLGLRFAEAIQVVGEGNLFLSLILMALGCLVLGMGMPTVPAYLIIILVMGPAIESLGVETIAAHLFVVYYAVLSSVTPPVALAAFAAAPIAKTNPIALSVTALRLATVGFLIPFAFVYHPSLLIITDSFSTLGLIMALITTSSAVLLICWGFSYKGWLRALLVIVGIIAISPYWWLQTISLITTLFVLIKNRSKKKYPKATQALLK